MSRYADSDPSVDPVTGILKNRLAITDEAALEKTEAAFAATRAYELSQASLKGKFDLAHLQAIHRHLFGDLYEWAGELRNIDIGQGREHVRPSWPPCKRRRADLQAAGRGMEPRGA